MYIQLKYNTDKNIIQDSYGKEICLNDEEILELITNYLDIDDICEVYLFQNIDSDMMYTYTENKIKEAIKKGHK